MDDLREGHGGVLQMKRVVHHPHPHPHHHDGDDEEDYDGGGYA